LSHNGVVTALADEDRNNLNKETGIKQFTLTLALALLVSFPLMAERRGGARKAGARHNAKTHVARHKAQAKNHVKNHKADTAEHKEKHQQHASDHRERHVDRRENRQAKRIEHGIANGSLTVAEVSGLKSSAKSIADLQVSFKSDGKISKDEGKELRSALNSLSKDIFFEKHDTEGHQMAVRRLGKGRTVYLSSELISKFENGELTGKAARAITADMHKMVHLRMMLGGRVGLAKSKREKLQAEYNDLLNKYFVEGEQEELSGGEKAAAAEVIEKRKGKWDSLTDEQKEKVKAALKKRRAERVKRARRHYKHHKKNGGDDE